MTLIMRLGVAPILAALACWWGYRRIGSHADDAGLLQAPFHLLAGGWALMALGVVAVVGSLAMRVRR